MKLKDICSKLDQRLPLALQEKWDHSGLNLGDPNANVTGILFSYDVCKEVIAHARKRNCQLIISHHPFRMKSEVNLRLDEYEGQLIRECIKNDIALYSCHTNHDASRDSLNFHYLTQLGAINIKPLTSSGLKLFKLAVYTPDTHTPVVLDALFKSGAGTIGNYDECSFRLRGKGTFRGLSGTNPTIGKIGQREEVSEDKIEVIVADHLISTVVRTLIQVHPYEEVAYDLIPIVNTASRVGLGACGTFPKPVHRQDLLKKLKRLFEVKHLRFVSSNQDTFSKIAICTGSGTSLLHQALRCEADVFVTGDVKYHQAVEAKRHDLALVDPGHFHSEKHSIILLQQLFEEVLGRTIKYHTYKELEDVFELI